MHFSGPPAMPTARAPLAFTIWPTTVPTAPVAAEQTTVSPAFGTMMRLTPTHAVTPGMPSGPRKACSGTLLSSTLRSIAGFWIE